MAVLKTSHQQEAAVAWHRGRAYAQDLRDRVLAASGSIAEIARHFEVSVSYVVRARARRRLGEESPRAQRNHVAPRLAGLEPALAAEVERRNDQTLAELCAWAGREHGVRVGLTTMWKTLARLGLTLEKKTLHASEQQRADVAAARSAWAAERRVMEPGRLVFLDQT